jgi:hypothetical protein
MCCHDQLARCPAPSSPRHANRDDPQPLSEGTAAARTGAHEERSRIHGIGALAMFALWMALPWLLAVLMCRRRDDGDLQPNRRPAGIRQIGAVAQALLRVRAGHVEAAQGPDARAATVGAAGHDTSIQGRSQPQSSCALGS